MEWKLYGKVISEGDDFMLSLFAIFNALIKLGILLLFIYIANSILKSVKQTNKHLEKISKELMKK